MTSYAVMQFVDGKMVSEMAPPDPAYVAAQGNGGMAVWLALSLALGAMGVINTFVSQNLGQGTPQPERLRLERRCGCRCFGRCSSVPYALSLPLIFRSMGHPPRLVRRSKPSTRRSM